MSVDLEEDKYRHSALPFISQATNHIFPRNRGQGRIVSLWEDEGGEDG